jgi:hypothetical protein
MKRLFSILIVIFLLTMSIGSFNSVFAQDDFNFDFDAFGKIGDYMEFRMDDEGEDTIMTGFLRFEITHEESISVQGKSYNCLVMTIKGSGDIESYSGIEGTWSATGNVWGDKVTEHVVKETMTMKMFMEYQGEIMTMKMESTTIPISHTSTWTSDNDPGQGDTWTETSIDEVTTTEIMVSSEGKETDTNTETITTVTHYEYLKDETVITSLGTFDCMVIKNYDEEESYYSDFTYDLDYDDKIKNIHVKSEMFEDGILENKMELIAINSGGQKMGDEVIGSIGNRKDEEDTGLFGMGKVGSIDVFILTIAIIFLLIILVLAGVTFKRHKKSKVETAQSYTNEGMHRGHTSAGQPAYQQPQPPSQSPSPPPTPQYQYQGPAYQQSQPQSQISPPPSTAPSRPRYTCQTCGGPLEYTKQYDRWYCDYCRRYQ